MRQFSQYYSDKLGDESFRKLFEQECHVCLYTVQIFEKMTEEKKSLEQLAAQIRTDPKKIRLLMDADYCDPYLVIQLCQHLGLPAPPACSRIDSEPHLSDNDKEKGFK